MRKVVILKVVFLLIIVASCNDKRVKLYFPEDQLKEHNIPSFDIRVERNLQRINASYIMNIIMIDSINFIETNKKNLENFEPYETLQAIELMRDNIKDFIFYKYYLYNTQNGYSLQHIEYPIDSLGRKKVIIYTITKNYENIKLNSAYIKWSSKPYNELPDYLMKDYENFVPLYLWEINFLTDTITSNLSFKTIQRLYPDFQGKYIFKKYKEIIIDHSYSSFDRSLFEKIKFVE